MGKENLDLQTYPADYVSEERAERGFIKRQLENRKPPYT
jgi:hypothetical protein